MSSKKEPDESCESGVQPVSRAGWGDEAEAIDAGLASENRRAVRRWMLSLAVAVACAATVFSGWHFLRPLPDLNEVRQQLGRSMKGRNAAERAATAADAEIPLREYLAGRGPERDSAKLLLATSLVQQSRVSAENLKAGLEISDLLAELDPGQCTTEDLVLGVSSLVSAGYLEQADSLVTVALTRSDRREESLRLAADLRFSLGRDDDAVLDLCRELAELLPADPYPLQMMGHLCERKGYVDRLIKVQRRLLELNVAHADETRRWLVENLIKIGEAGEARREFERLKSIAPKIVADHPLIEARLLYLEGRREEALKVVEQSLKTRPDAFGALLLAGRIELARSHVAEAIHLLERAVQLDPSVPDAHYLLGQAYVQAGSPDKAKREMDLHRLAQQVREPIYKLERRALQMPGEAAIRSELARLYERLGWPERAAMWRNASPTSPITESQMLWNLHVVD